MPKASRADAAVEKVAALRDAPNDAALEKALNQALGDAHPRVVLSAAKIIEDRELEGHGTQLCDAFERLLGAEAPHKLDPNCRAKAAVLRALLRTDGTARPAIFERGVAFVQSEPVRGGYVDTAAEVRGYSALGLIRSRHADGLVLSAKLLADPEHQAREAAADAFAEAPRDSALPLLRYKIAMGDESAGVMGAVFSSYLAIDAAQALELATEYLTHAREEFAEAVVLAIGSARPTGGFPMLRDYSARAQGVLKETAFTAMSLLRDDAATAFLLEVVAEAPEKHAEMAVNALAHFKHDDKLRERVRAAAKGRAEAAVARAVAKSFG
ncbi:MAG: hypothetical protein QM723_08000 [Myxococcaceae bacterium]